MKNLMPLIAIALFLFAFTACSPKISKTEYNRLQYEHEQLQLRYDLLKKQTGNPAANLPEGSTTKGNGAISSKIYLELKEKYEQALAQNQAMETELQLLKTQPSPESFEIDSKTLIDTEEVFQLQNDYLALQKQYQILELRHRQLQASFAAATNQTDEPFPVLEEVAVIKNTSAVTTVRLGELLFDFERIERTDNLFKIIFFVKNDGGTSHLQWDSKKMELLADNGATYSVYSYRIGEDYADQESGVLKKKIKSEYTLRAVMAFENVPFDVQEIVSLKFLIKINDVEQLIKFDNLAAQ